MFGAGPAWERDGQFEATKISKVEPADDGWFITRTDGRSIFVPSSECAQQPEPGEWVHLYGRGVGATVRGIVINSRCYRYQTAEESERQRLAEIQKSKDDKRARLESERAERDAAIARLCEPLQRRVLGFIAQGGDEWRAEFEPYEVFVCKEAQLIADTLKTEDEIRRFHRASIEDQKQMVPAVAYDEHSGNTFGAACQLARVLVAQPDIAPRVHGALCPLTGCKDYGCHAVRGE